MSPRPDPDAIWKPGYDGPVRYDRVAAVQAASGRRWPPVAVTGAVIVLLVVSGLAVVWMGRTLGDDVSAPEVVTVETSSAPPSDAVPPSEAPSSGLPVSEAGSAESSWVTTIPGSVWPRWQVQLDTDRVAVVAAGDRTVVAIVDRPGTLVAFETADGAERWRHQAPGESPTGVHLVDGMVVVGQIDGDAVGAVTAHDIETGTPQWRRLLAVGEALVVFDGEILITRVRTIAGRPPGADVIDPRSGVPTARRSPDETPPAGTPLRLSDREGRRAIDLVDGSSVALESGFLRARTGDGVGRWQLPIAMSQSATVVSGGLVVIDLFDEGRSAMTYLR